ncbi:MAG TPA: carboxypeptidase regulatory-like domain-containing protein [Candidatus Elarobacter sp.]|nr:carboxypeptidase regulatory-like domain-containing protein [Candidatus Elarobacter sp.]
MKAAFLLAALALAGCSTPASPSAVPADASFALRSPTDLLGSPPMAKLQVSLFDAPVHNIADLKFNLGILGVQLIAANGTAVPYDTETKPRMVDLLDLQTHSLDFNGSAPAGGYSGVRLLIDTASSNVTVKKFTIPIVWGTKAQPIGGSVVAIDFPCNFVLSGVKNALGDVALDFNVLHSVRYTGNKIYVEPTVVAANAPAQISGAVHNAAGKPVTSAVVLAVDPLGRVVNSTVTGNDGRYNLHALSAGVYTIQVKNSYVTAQGDTVTAVGADAGAAPSTPAVVSPNDKLELPVLVD